MSERWRRPTMSVSEAAELVGLDTQSVRRWIDANEADGTPVAAMERDERGKRKPGSWRRPYRDAVECWAARRRGEMP